MNGVADNANSIEWKDRLEHEISILAKHWKTIKEQAMSSYQLETTLNSHPATHAFAVTASNTVDLPHVTRFIMVGVAGDVAVVTLNGDSVTLKGVAAGVPIPICVRQILSTGTAATGIVGLY